MTKLNTCLWCINFQEKYCIFTEVSYYLIPTVKIIVNKSSVDLTVVKENFQYTSGQSPLLPFLAPPTFSNVKYNVQSPKNIHNSKHTFYFVNSFRLSYDIGHNFFWETVLSVELIHSKNGCVFKTKARDDITKTHDTSGKW